MAKTSESVRIEVKKKDQATLLNYALGVVHQTLAERMSEVADDKLDHFLLVEVFDGDAVDGDEVDDELGWEDWDDDSVDDADGTV